MSPQDPDRSLPLLLLLLTPACLFSLAFVWSADLWWYLASGREILAQGGIPDRDVFVYALDPPAPWLTHSWLWTLLLAALHAGFGLGALPLLGAALVAALVVLLFRSARLPGDRYGLLNALLVGLVVMAGAYRFSLRAELPGWLLFVVFLRLLDREPRGRGTLALLVGLEVVWANLHGGFVLGILTVLCYAPRWTPALLLAPLATPGFGADRLAESAEVLRRLAGGVTGSGVSDAGALPIVEWASPFAAFPSLGSQAPLLYGVLLLVGAASFVWGRRPLHLARLVLFLAMAGLGAWALRFLAGFAIASAFVSLRNFAERPGAGGLRVPRRLQAVCAVAVGAGCLVVAAGVWLSRADYEVGQSADHVFTLNPRNSSPGAADYLLRHAVPGPIFNEMQLGGYLAFRLFPETGQQVFIDGRILHPMLLREHGEILVGRGWPRALRAHGFNAVVLSNLAHANLPLRSRLVAARDWHLAYLDPQAVVFVRSQRTQPQAEIHLDAVPFLGDAAAPGWRRLAARPLLDGSSLRLLETCLDALLQLGRNAEVARFADAALRRGHDGTTLHRQRGAALLQLGRPADALADLASVAERAPRNPLALFNYAVALNATGRAQEALRELDRAHALDPADPGVARFRSRLRATLAAPAEAPEPEPEAD